MTQQNSRDFLNQHDISGKRTIGNPRYMRMIGHARLTHLLNLLVRLFNTLFLDEVAPL